MGSDRLDDCAILISGFLYSEPSDFAIDDVCHWLTLQLYANRTKLDQHALTFAYGFYIFV